MATPPKNPRETTQQRASRLDQNTLLAVSVSFEGLAPVEVRGDEGHVLYTESPEDAARRAYKESFQPNSPPPQPLKKKNDHRLIFFFPSQAQYEEFLMRLQSENKGFNSDNVKPLAPAEVPALVEEAREQSLEDPEDRVSFEINGPSAQANALKPGVYQITHPNHKTFKETYGDVQTTLNELKEKGDLPSDFQVQVTKEADGKECHRVIFKLPEQEKAAAAFQEKMAGKGYELNLVSPAANQQRTPVQTPGAITPTQPANDNNTPKPSAETPAPKAPSSGHSM